MKKNFAKKLSVALAMAMAVSTLAPAASADAAAAPAFKSYKSSVYENGTSEGTYSYTVKNIKKNYTVKWSVTGDAKDYVSVSKKSTKATKTTVSNKIVVATNGEAAAKNAKATVVAKVYNTKNKLVKTIKDAVTVKVQATDVTIAAKEGTLTTAVGASLDFDRTLTPANSTSKTYYSVDSTDATVDANGVFTATKAGEYTVTATVRNAKDSKVLATTTQKVVVKDVILNTVAQTKGNELTATFVGDTKNLKAADFVITNTATKAVVAVKAVAVDKNDATKVTITTYGDMVDGKVYTVAFDGTTKEFTATEGIVAGVNVTPSVITAAKAKKVYVQTLDAKGVILSEKTFDKVDSKITCSITPSNGYTDVDKLYLPNVGDTATVKVTYHTYKYDEAGNEVGAIEKEFTITAVKDDATVSNFQYTIATNAPAWTATSFVANTKTQVGVSAKVFFNIKDSNGDPIATADYANYSLSSSDSSVLLVAEDALTSKSVGVDVLGVNAGTAYIIVKDTVTKNIVTSVPVTVVKASNATTLVLDKSAVSVSTGAGMSAVIKTTVNDQYGEKMDVAYDSLTLEVLSKPSTNTAQTVGAAPVGVAADPVNHTITVTGSAFALADVDFGTVTIKATAKIGDYKVSRVFSATAVKAVNTATYDIVLSETTNDVTVTKKTVAGDKTVTVKVAEVKNGVPVSYVTGVSSVAIKRISDNTVVASTDDTGADVVTNAAITIDTTAQTAATIIVLNDTATNDFKKTLEAGNYLVTVKYNGKVLNKNFTITDNQGTATAEILVNDLENTTNVTTLLQDTTEEKAIITYQGVVQTITAADIDKLVGKSLTNGGVYIDYAMVKVTVPDSTNKVLVKLPINKSFTNVASGDIIVLK